MKSLNDLQKKILFGGMCAAVVMVLIPPWTSIVNLGDLHKASFEGYHLLFDPPKVPAGFREEAAMLSSFSINYKLLLIQLVALIFVDVSAVMWLQSSDKNKPDAK